MRTKLGLLLLIFLFPMTMLAQEDWRDRTPRQTGDDERDREERERYRNYRRDNTVDLTPFAGYTWGGTIFERESNLFRTDADVASNPNVGISLGIPVGDNGMKLELLATRQSSELEAGGGLFDPGATLADIDVTYLHAGVLFPFAPNRTATPFVVVSAGIANVDPDVAGVQAENRFSMSAGVGVKVPINRNLGFRVEGRGFFTALEDDNDCSFCDNFEDRNFYQGQVNFGLIFSF